MNRVDWSAEDAVGGALRVGDRPVQAFWPLLRGSFRRVLLAPHRRASGDTIIWSWSAPPVPAVPTSADLDGVRRRLGHALVDLAEELDRRDAQAGSRELPGAVEEMVRGLMRAPDAQLAACAVSTEMGWMVRSWGVATPAPAQCSASVEDERPADEDRVVDSEEALVVAPSRSGGRRRRLLAGAIIAGLIFAAAAWWWSSPHAPEAASLTQKTRQPAANDERESAAYTDNTAIPFTKGERAASPTAANNISAGRAGGTDEKDSPLLNSTASVHGNGAGSLTPASSTPQSRTNGPERAIPVAGKDAGLGESSGQGAASGGAIDQSRPMPAPTRAAPSGDHPPAKNPDSSMALPATDAGIPGESAMPAIADGERPTVDGAAGAAAPPSVTAPLLSSLEKESRGETDPARSPPPAERAAEENAVAPDVGTATDAVENRSAAADAMTAARAVAETIGTARVITLRIGEWRTLRVRDVVLSTWPGEQPAKQTLRAARDEAKTRIKAGEPVSFHQPRVRAGWWLRLAGKISTEADPVWKDAVSGNVWRDGGIDEGGVRVGWTGLMPDKDMDLRLVTRGGHVLAALIIDTQHRQAVLRVGDEVSEAAPWFELRPTEAEAAPGRFRWQSLLPAAWPDRGWEHTRSSAGGTAVVCRGTAHRGAETINGLLGVVDQDAGWAMSCALRLETTPAAP
jgi:hypothetical protein